MKILIQNDGPHAFYYIRLGLAKAFNACGHEVQMWEASHTPVFDVFDSFQPDLFIGQTYNTSKTICEAIKERPHMKVIMKAGDWGPFGDTLDRQKYPLLMASEQEKKTILDLYEETGKPDFVHIHYHQDALEQTHGYWQDHGVPIESILNAADIYDYTRGVMDKRFESDLTFIGGYWGYKAQTFDKWLLPLCADYTCRIKIFGNSGWPIPQYCGFIPDEMTKYALASATICPNLSEPHSQVFGFDIIERPFKLLSNGCFVISDYVECLEKIIPDGIVYAKTPTEFKDMVSHFLANPMERIKYMDHGYQAVMNEHTYFHRVKQIFEKLNLPTQAAQVDSIYNQIRSQL